MKISKHLPFLFFASAILLAFPGIAQQSNLCVGAYYSEEEGARKLNQVMKSIRSLKDWQAHADSVRRQIRAGMQMEKFPAKTPLNPKYRNKKVLDGYTVEAVVFESLPGFFVTGNLYRPVGNFKNKSLAVIASPHGHWNKPEDYGRFRSETQQRCAAFAKMGAIAFSYDMVGYGESQQLDHSYEKVVIFQTWNTIRIIDFLLSFPEADPARVAVPASRVVERKHFWLRLWMIASRSPFRL